MLDAIGNAALTGSARSDLAIPDQAANLPILGQVHILSWTRGRSRSNSA